jgi:membrane-associated PAP2 superfamily phosphatase
MYKDIWFMRVFVQNGLAMYATWATVASVFNFAVVLTFRTGAEQEVGSMVSLTVFTLEIIAWWVFDNFVFEKLLRYLLMPYVVVLLSIIGIISKNWTPGATNSIYTVTLLSMTSLLAIIKCILAIYKHWKHPIFNTKSTYRRPVVSFEVRSLLEAQPHS